MNEEIAETPTGERAAVKSAMRNFEAELQSFYGDYAPEIRVYGSQARGEATPDSDIDVLLLFQRPVNPGKEIQRLAPLLADLNLRYGVLISVLPASENEYRQSSEMFWMNVRKEGVRIEAI